MLRGCQREMIVLQTQESAVFESAWFVLRRERTAISSDDMLTEANRIIGIGTQYRPGRRRFPERIAWLLLGALLGAGIFAMVCFFVL